MGTNTVGSKIEFLEKVRAQIPVFVAMHPCILFFSDSHRSNFPARIGSNSSSNSSHMGPKKKSTWRFFFFSKFFFLAPHCFSHYLGRSRRICRNPNKPHEGTTSVWRNFKDENDYDTIDSVTQFVGEYPKYKNFGLLLTISAVWRLTNAHAERGFWVMN